MLARVGAGQEALRVSLPPGAKRCRAVGERLAELPRDLAQVQLKPIRTSILPRQELQAAAVSGSAPAVMQAATLDMVRMGSQQQGSISPKVSTPTAFQLDEPCPSPGAEQSPAIPRQVATTQQQMAGEKQEPWTTAAAGGAKSRPALAVTADRASAQQQQQLPVKVNPGLHPGSDNPSSEPPHKVAKLDPASPQQAP
mmetsp:Transcript_16767/g.46854  ORF Transcript_16767/g.46854 Transcript_16767/m.46854 type:complete len:197 (+) Transcript_16767:151-741(+)